MNDSPSHGNGASSVALLTNQPVLAGDIWGGVAAMLVALPSAIAFGVAIVAIRDFYVIDEESQTVMVSAVFRREAGEERRRNHFTEVFHIDGGKIRDIHAAFYYAPEDRPVPNWAPYDGLFPLPASYR